MKGLKLFVVLGVMISLVAFACEKKKEEKPLPAAPESPRVFNPNMLTQNQPQSEMKPASPQEAMNQASPHGELKPKVTKAIVVPEEVKGKWSKVKLIVQDKSSGKKTEYTVKLGSELEIPGSGLKVAVGQFLPDFTMDNDTITSKSNEPNNPAVRIEVFEKGQSIYKGWLYAKFPQIHPFEHQKYGLSLIEGIKS
ncbi:MAG: DUF2155 domain-containing protein [Dissulfurispiraceae bacterium]